VMRRWFRSMAMAVSLAAVLGTSSLAFAVPAAAASDTRGSIAAAPRCAASTGTAALPVNPLDGTAACARGPTDVEQVYEAAIAGAGLLALGGATLIYRRRHPRGPRGLGPRAPQG
jgi:hypothetical protein